MTSPYTIIQHLSRESSGAFNNASARFAGTYLYSVSVKPGTSD